MDCERTNREFRGRGLCVTATAFLMAWASAGAADQWRLIPVEVEGEKNAIITDFAMAGDGTPWAALSRPQGVVCTWDGNGWQKISGNFHSSRLGHVFHVSPTGRVYLCQIASEGSRSRRESPKPHQGVVYELKDGQAKWVTEYYYDTGYDRPLLYFDSHDRIWNWGDMFLAKFEKGKWERVEASVGSQSQIIEDPAGNIYCFGKTLAYYRNEEFTTNVPLPYPAWEHQGPPRGYLWGTDKALFFSSRKQGVVVVDLNTLQQCDVLHADPLSDSDRRQLYSGRRDLVAEVVKNTSPLMRSPIWGAFRDREGNIWALGASPQTMNCIYIKIDVSDNSVEEKLETAALDRGMSVDPKAILCARDGTIYFGGMKDGIYIYRDGAVTHIGWTQGLAINRTDWVCEHPDGTIWFASRCMGVAVYDPAGVPDTGLGSPFLRTWERYPLATYTLIRDFDGSLWCHLKSHPQEVSRWNGQAWEHFDLGCDTARVRIFAVDNLHRLHVLSLSQQGQSACRFAEDHIDRFADLRSMLVDSVRTGSREFRSDTHDSFTPLVVGEQEIWYQDGTSRQLYRYSQGQWHGIEVDLYQTNLFRHKDNQVLIAGRKGFTTLDRGQLTEFVSDHTRNQEYLLGESGLQPFDEAVYEKRKSELFPASKTDRSVYVFENMESFESFQKNKVPTGVAKFSWDLDRICLAEGGFWAYSNGLWRYCHGLQLPVDLAVTPAGPYADTSDCSIYEDLANNLWIHGSNMLFRVKRPKLDTQITTPQVTEWASPSLRVEFTGTADGPVAEPLSYAWRLDGGPWSTPSGQTHADLEFAEVGSHKFEVVSIGSMGNLDTTPAVMTVNVSLPAPEVRIVAAPREVVTDLDVAVAWEVAKRPEGRALTFQWRLDGGDWLDTQETTLRPSGLADGEHTIEVRAIADGKYIQAPPTSAKFEVRVDYEKVIASAVKRLYSRDFEQREATTRMLVALGRRCLPALRAELERADEDTQWWIQAVIGEIENRRVEPQLRR